MATPKTPEELLQEQNNPGTSSLTDIGNAGANIRTLTPPPDAPEGQPGAVWNGRNWEKPTPVASPEPQPVQTDLNKKMSDFTTGQQTNQYGELVNAPSAEQVNNFNKQFTTGTELQPTQPEIPKQVEVTKVETTPNATTTTKETPQAPIDQNKRNQEILNNLNEGLKNDPIVQQAINTGNPELFKSKYSSQNPAEQKIIDDYFNAHTPNNPESIFNLLRTGQNQFSDTIKNTPAYTQATKRFNDFNKFSSYDTPQFQTALVSGDVLPGTQTYNDLTKDPIIKLKLDKAQQLNTINGTKTDLQKIEDNGVASVTNSPLGQALSDNYLSPEEKSALINTPALKEKARQAEETAQKLNELQVNYDRIPDDVEESVKGKDLTNFEKSVMIANARKLLGRELDLAQRNATTAYGMYKDARDESLSNFKDNLDLYKEQKKARDDKLALDEKRKYDEQQAKEKLQNEFDYTYGDINSTDPRIKKQAIQLAVDEVRKTYEGMPFVRTSGAMTNDIEKLLQANPGMTLSQALDENIVQAVQNSPDYANWKANNKQLAEQKTQYGFTNVGGDLYRTDDKGNISLAIKGEKTPAESKWTKLDDGLYQDAQGGIHTKQELDQQQLLNNSLLNTKPGTNVGIECGQYARTATGLTATPGGNSLSARKEAFNSATPAPGGLVLFSGGGYDKTYGHIAVVTGVNADGTINVKEANYRGDKKVTERKNIPTTYVSGYYNNTPLAGGSEEKPITDKQYTQYNQALGRFTANPEVKAFESALSSGGDLLASLKSANGPGDVGAVFQFMKTLDPTSTVREGEFALAGKSAGVWEQIKNIPKNKLEGNILTEDQRKAFGKLAFAYIKNKAKVYDIKYNDLTRVLKNQGIPDSYYPTKMSDNIKSFENPQSTGTSTPNKVKASNGKTYSLPTK